MKLAIAVGHLHPRQRLRVDCQLRIDQCVLRQDIRRQRIDLIVGQRARLGPRHRPANIVEQGRRVWPLVSDCCRFVDPVDRLVFHQCRGRGERPLTGKPRPCPRRHDKARTCRRRLPPLLRKARFPQAGQHLRFSGHTERRLFGLADPDPTLPGMLPGEDCVPGRPVLSQ